MATWPRWKGSIADTNQGYTRFSSHNCTTDCVCVYKSQSNKRTAVRCVCLGRSSSFQSQLQQETWWRPTRWGLLLTHCCDRGFTLSVSSSTTRVRRSSCPSHLQPPLSHKERSGMLEDGSLFCPPDMRAQPDSKRNSGALRGGNKAAVWFLWLFPIFCLCLISHAWRCLKVEPQRHGGKMWGLYLAMLCLFLLTFFCWWTRSHTRFSSARSTRRGCAWCVGVSVCVCVTRYGKDLVSCSSF